MSNFYYQKYKNTYQFIIFFKNYIKLRFWDPKHSTPHGTGPTRFSEPRSSSSVSQFSPLATISNVTKTRTVSCWKMDLPVSATKDWVQVAFFLHLQFIIFFYYLQFEPKIGYKQYEDGACLKPTPDPLITDPDPTQCDVYGASWSEWLNSD